MKNIIITAFAMFMFPNVFHSQTVKNIEEIAPFNEGLAAVRQGNQWGFINEEGQLVINFRNDIYWNQDADTSKKDISGVQYPMFNEGRCLITKIVEDGVPVFGFMDTKGNVVLEPQLLNVYPFKNGFTTAVLFEKSMKGKNEFNLDIYEFKFHDVMLDISGEIVEFFNRRYNIQMTKKRYQRPSVGVKQLSKGLVGVHTQDQGWEVRKITLNN
ncbi:WG repeat-containing protein [Arenibacter troitsensis]|uniref:WG containing repeat-containing protein n=1 Tax=Arenibacter troitsensis TaxID=188872 RepID=A0A1X7ITK0_9FLAO|nr:WG repeat-containing protein [Arenibacter troitsensis]SMG18513.1 WG containing repeat-containing protein [Arenibacter troitsensis]